MWFPGQWWALCDRCGMKFLSGDLKQEWTNLMVCDGCYEERHPQEFIRPVREQAPSWSRPDAMVSIDNNEYVDGLYMAPYDSTNMPGEYTNRLGIN